MSILTQGHFLIYGYNNFTQKGYKKASKAKDWEDINSFDLTGKSYMVTGANSGLGLSASKYFASRGGVVHMICRSKEKGEKARDDIISLTKNTNVHLHVCDVAKPSDIRSCFEKFEKEGHNLDVLVNNAGVMLDNKNNTADGLDETFATNTLSTFLFTVLALPFLHKSKSPRVIIVSSGGALTEPLIIRDDYDKQPKQWSGRTAYARTKRHQIALTELFAEKFTKSTGIGFYCMHPGWADTPAVATSMPDFYKTFYKVLRTPDEGSDTMWWLGATSKIDLKYSGEFFRDRAPEIKHFWLGSTKYTSTQAQDLWKWCCETSKWSEDELKNKL